MHDVLIKSQIAGSILIIDLINETLYLSVFWPLQFPVREIRN